MASNIVGIGNVVNEIVNELRRYTTIVAEEVEEAKDIVSKDLVKNLKETSPKQTGAYARSWTRTKQGNKYIIHVKSPHYRLTHLLEKGHAKVGGGRVAAKVHIRPAEVQAINDYLERIERAIQQ